MLTGRDESLVGHSAFLQALERGRDVGGHKRSPKAFPLMYVVYGSTSQVN